MVSAWVEGRSKAGDRVRRALVRAGIEVVEAEDAPAVLVLDRLDATATRRVAALRHEARRRVLVVHVGATRPREANVWRLLAAGADEVIAWDDTTAHQVRARLERWQEVDRLLASPKVRSRLVGDSAAWRDVLRRVVEIARFTSSALLVTGETGTGKELLADLVHRLDQRRGKPPTPVILDCSRLVEGLSGSEFFGHEVGAFTGAVATRDGAFAHADGGTLFLDEVGELDPRMQAELLRVVQEGSYKRLGSDVWRRTHFRLVCATHRDLHAEQLAGTFRDDLYHRLTAAHVHLPPLRERREDVLPLYRHFAEKLGREPAPPLDPVVERMLVERPYPGNVRELRQVTERLLARHVGPGPITVGDVAPEDRPGASAPTTLAPSGSGAGELLRALVGRLLQEGLTLDQVKRDCARLAVEMAVEMADDDLTEAARMLQVSRRALEERRRAALESSGPEAVREVRGA